AMVFLLLVGFSPILYGVYFSQVQPFLLFLIILGWAALKKNKSYFTGLCWGLSIALKLFTWPLLILLIFQNSRSAFVWTLSSAIAFSFLPVFFWGLEVWTLFFSEALPVVGEWAVFSIYNVGVGGTLFRLLHRYDFVSMSDKGATFLLTHVLPMLIL